MTEAEILRKIEKTLQLVGRTVSALELVAQNVQSLTEVVGLLNDRVTLLEERMNQNS